MVYESMDNTQAQAGPAVRAVQDVAERAGSYVQQQLTDLSDRAQNLAREYTGRPFDEWVGDVRHFVRTHPLQALVATIGIGYILGKIARR
jgi:ElaB/YqjD/DUF883 family membrane-anchored ribosome-binding protein